MLKLNAKQLRSSSLATRKNLPRGKAGEERETNNEIYIVLDNVLDTYNIGSIFRLADAVGAKEVILCGGSTTPPDARIKKASINTAEWVKWRYFETAADAVRQLRTMNHELQVVVIEQSAKSVRYDQFKYKIPICVVVGHESEGVSQEVLEMADGVVELPMFGVNISLNVVVSLGIVLYKLLEVKH